MDPNASSHGMELEPGLRAKLASLREEGQEIFHRFDIEVRQKDWHAFMPADYARVQQDLLPFRRPGLKFMEWGSATGVITVMADLLGFEAYGIELDPGLVATARDLADRFDSRARFAAGSFLPAGYEWRSPEGDPRLGTLGEGAPGYVELEYPLEEFDLVFGYPWGGEEPIMHDIMRRRGGEGARLLVFGKDGIKAHSYDAPKPSEIPPPAA